MFLAMVLTNAKREEARALTLTVDRAEVRIDMLLLDGSSRQLSAPPSEIMIKIIETLEGGERTFESSVYSITIDAVDVQRGPDNMVAYISQWNMEHR
jgi:hypothetical protein